ncbi:MAG: ATP-binding protein [Candidatus Rokuibacteriota bacterium]
MMLEAIPGQARATELLTRALATDRVAHAYAFVGPPDSERMTAALAFGRALLCDQGGCGACRVCGLVDSRRHPDLHVVVPTPPESNPKGARAIRIGAIRELERQASLRPAMARRRVIVLDEAERMTGESPQAFLKFLEEPPAGTTVILILPRARAVPATVLSRCQIVRFLPPARQSGAGAVGDVAALLEEIRAQGPIALFRRTDRIDRDGVETLVDACWLHCRDLLLARAGAPARLLLDAERADALAAEASRWSDARLLEAIEACRAAREALIHNVTARLTAEVLLSTLARRAA